MPKRVIPFGQRILVKRRKTGERAGESSSIILPEQTADRPTDLADVVYVPDMSFCDEELIRNSPAILNSLTKKAAQGDAEALDSLMKFNSYIKAKSIKVGDAVMISKYVGVDFHDNKGGGMLTLCFTDDVIGLVVDDD